MQILSETQRNIAQSTQLAETISDVFTNFIHLKYFENLITAFARLFAINQMILTSKSYDFDFGVPDAPLATLRVDFSLTLHELLSTKI